MQDNSLEAVTAYLTQLQAHIVEALSAIDPTADVCRDNWQREEGGGGCTQVIRQGDVFEQGGVNFSSVHGKTLPPSASQLRPQLAGCPFNALGISLVLHPRNPYVPTVHANLRFFFAQPEKADPVWWFGGGFDLTPYYGFVDDCVHWHQTAKQACDPFGDTLYSQCKAQCDDYFYIKHRKEARGIGGLFFDDLNHWEFARCFDFVQSVGDHFLPAYLPLVKRRKDTPYGKRERDFQCYRRGRYVEFNLVYDRGTLFGLQSDGRVESILVSLPPEVHWHYAWKPEKGSSEAKLKDFLQAQDWIQA